MFTYNVWCAFSTAAIDEYKAKKNDPSYDGPMTDAIFKGLSRVKDGDVVTGLFDSFSFGGKTYKMFSLYFDENDNVQKVKDFFDALEANWPEHFELVGVWHWDGRQVGTQWELDENGERVFTVNEFGKKIYHTTGTPTYPIHPQAWRFMPDEHEHDLDGNVIDTIPATSNADLRDVNLVVGQAQRRFA